MKRTAFWVGGLVVFVLFVGVIGAKAVCAAAPYLVKCGGVHSYYVRDAVVHDNGDVTGWRYIIERDDIRDSWGLSADDVHKMSTSKFEGAPLKGVVTYAPGTLLKVEDHWDIYAVTRSRVLRRLDTEGVAAKFFGYDWKDKIKIIPASWMQQYQLGIPIIDETWTSWKEQEVSAAALYEATDPRWRERAAVLRDQERLEHLQDIIIPFLYDQIKIEGNSSPTVYEKWLLGKRGAGWVYATDDLNNRFRRVPISSCSDLTDGSCIYPAPDVQINTDICGMQAPYGYASRGGFELSFCIESESAQWMPRTDDFDSNDAIRNLRPGWYKYTPDGLDRISS